MEAVLWMWAGSLAVWVVADCLAGNFRYRAQRALSRWAARKGLRSRQAHLPAAWAFSPLPSEDDELVEVVAVPQPDGSYRLEYRFAPRPAAPEQPVTPDTLRALLGSPGDGASAVRFTSEGGYKGDG